MLVLMRRLVVPNMIADLDQAPRERVDKPVWRVAFFGRLEERKGIKLFVDAVQVCARPSVHPGRKARVLEQRCVYCWSCAVQTDVLGCLGRPSVSAASTPEALA
jgi:glycosyltransferase involved in cell wall biosynthesis